MSERGWFWTCLTVQLVGLGASACTLLRSPEAQVVENAALCILEHSTEPPRQILVDCAGTTLEQVAMTIAASDRSAAARRAAASRDGGPPKLDMSDPWADAACDAKADAR